MGTKDFGTILGDKITECLDKLSERLDEYKEMGATFAKWRAIYNISENTPSDACMKVNAEAFAKYAVLCQNHDIILQSVVLNTDKDTKVSETGAGSPGKESTYFGAKTKQAVIKFQKKHGIVPASGFVGPITRAYINKLGYSY
jgi:peptidoglycan hydrolase-like protein with peptidoglycan-binding domain